MINPIKCNGCLDLLVKRPLTPPNEYSIENENATIEEARSYGLVLDLTKEFADGRHVHEMISALFVHFSRFRKQNSKVFRDIIVLLQQKDSEILTKLFDKILGMPIFARALRLRIPGSGVTLLHEAALFGHDGVVKKLLESGFDPNVKTTGAHEIVRDVGAHRFSFQIESGKNYLEFSQNAHEMYIKYTFFHMYGSQFLNTNFNDNQPRNFPLKDDRMIGAIADVNKPWKGQTLLYLAVTNYFGIPVILALLEKGANPLVPNSQNQNALDELISRNSLRQENRRNSIILALFLDAACSFDPKNLNKYEAIRKEKIDDKHFIEVLLEAGIFYHLWYEFRIIKRLKEPYNPLRFAFERAMSLQSSWESTYNHAFCYLDTYNKAKNEDGSDAIKTFVLPLFEERIALTEQSVDQSLTCMPKVLVNLIMSYIYINLKELCTPSDPIQHPLFPLN